MARNAGDELSKTVVARRWHREGVGPAPSCGWLPVLLAAWSLAAEGCDEPSATVDADAADSPDFEATEDGEPEDAAETETGCRLDEECDDNLFCNGSERCEPENPAADERGCVAAEAPCAATPGCDEDRDRCLTDCDVDPDADGDGREAVECGGDDCDDSREAIHPGAIEVCDDAGVDEDCNPETLGDRDLDGDGYLDSTCCNGARCGEDCNDARRWVSPAAAETCNGIDDDCDGDTDEGVRVSGWTDEDRDLHGDPARPMLGCLGAPGLSLLDDDCDDLSPAVHGSQAEICDGRDNDCDGVTDEHTAAVPWYRDADGDGFGDPRGEVRVSCEPSAGFSLLALDCDDGDRRVGPLVRETCNGRDDDCNGAADYVDAWGNGEDDDNDGFADVLCPGGTDCRDLDAASHPDAPELCDGRDNDCDGETDGDTEDADWWADRDGDGWGDASSPPVIGCLPLSGRVLRPGDCNDLDPRVHPAAADDCGGQAGVDDDCNGATDEQAMLGVWFADADGDGWGAGEPQRTCGPSGLHASPPGDCDDTEDGVHPEADEECEAGNGRDDDCDTRVDCDDPDCAAAARCVRTHTLTLLAGAGQSAPILAVLPLAAEVLVTDTGGAPVPGTTVRVVAPEGAAAVPATGSTDAGGRFRFRMRLGPVAGAVVYGVQADLAGSVEVAATALLPAEGTIVPLVNADLAPGDGGIPGPATLARLRNPAAAAVASDGTVYLADAGGHAVYRWTPAGTLRRFAGNGSAGFAGDGGPAADAQLAAPSGLALDESTGRLYVADRDNARVRVVDLRTGTIDTFAGGGTATGPEWGDGGPATDASLGPVETLGRGPDGALYLLSSSPNRVRRVDPVTGTITAFEETVSTCGEVGLVSITSFGWDAGGELFLLGRVGGTAAGTGADCAGATPGVVRRSPSGRIRPVAGRADGTSADGSAASRTRFAELSAVAFDPAGNLFLAERDSHRVRRIDAVTGVVTTVAGTGVAGAGGDHGPAVEALLSSPAGLAFNPDGHLLVVDGGNAALRVVWAAADTDPLMVRLGSPTGSGQTGVITAQLAEPLAATLTGPDGTPRAGAEIRFEADGGGAVTPERAMTGTDGVARTTARLGRAVGSQTYRARFLDLRERDVPGSPVSFTASAIAPAAGTILPLVNADHVAGASGIPGPGTTARLYNPTGLAVAADGTVYFASDFHHAVYALDPAGYVTRIAGGNGPGFSGDDGPALLAQLNAPWGIALDESRRWLYIADHGNWRVRRVHLGSGLITTVAGTGGSGTPPEDGTPAILGCIGGVWAVAVGPDGAWYHNISQGCGDWQHREVRMVDPFTGLTYRLVQGCTNCYHCAAWVGGRFDQFWGLVVDSMGRLLISADHRTDYSTSYDTYGDWSRTPGITRRALDGSLSRFAGIYSGSDIDGLPAVDTRFSSVYGLDVEVSGTIYVADPAGHRVRRIDGATSIVSTVAGDSATSGSEGDYGPAVDATLNEPRFVARTPDGHLLISDHAAHSIRLVW